MVAAAVFNRWESHTLRFVQHDIGALRFCVNVALACLRLG